MFCRSAIASRKIERKSNQINIACISLHLLSFSQMSLVASLPMNEYFEALFLVSYLFQYCLADLYRDLKTFLRVRAWCNCYLFRYYFLYKPCLSLFFFIYNSKRDIHFKMQRRLRFPRRVHLITMLVWGLARKSLPCGHGPYRAYRALCDFHLCS